MTQEIWISIPILEPLVVVLLVSYCFKVVFHWKYYWAIIDAGEVYKPMYDRNQLKTGEPLWQAKPYRNYNKPIGPLMYMVLFTPFFKAQDNPKRSGKARRLEKYIKTSLIGFWLPTFFLIILARLTR